ncbi:LANO_0B01882g1_1 [Lachancea nothofagi CBS 11611]|uniref:Type 1 phosphatases regulator n=1 Tax=Lachancea nothofagi CBS 11611 TaxID=1266666 RepID=A0A1G4IW60_9SACH|nr:LANO_0B01882g1_1 [Lachancea nothofagi CBS 11611]
MPQNQVQDNGAVGTQSGAATVTIPAAVPMLQLRGAVEDQLQAHTRESKTSAQRQRSKVRWKEDVVDNEHMNKKKSKVCCIFHPQQNFEDMDGESCEHDCHDDSSSSSSSSSESESESSKGMDMESRRKARKERRHLKLQQKRSSSPNAYEVQPDYSQLRDRYTGAGENNVPN